MPWYTDLMTNPINKVYDVAKSAYNTVNNPGQETATEEPVTQTTRQYSRINSEVPTTMVRPIEQTTPQTTTQPTTQSTIPVGQMPKQPSGLEAVDTSLDLSRLNNVNTDLSGVASGITSAGQRQVTSGDISRIAGLRPENEYETTLKNTISKLEDYTTGMSQADRTAANYMLSRLDASTAAATLSQAQRIASNPYLSEGAKNAAIAEQMREAGTQRSQVVGELAQQAQERAYSATQKLADVSQTAAAFKENMFEFDVAQAGNEITRDLNAKIAAGDLTKSQATLELQKASEMINAAKDQAYLELDKQKSIASNKLQETEVEIAKVDLAQKQYSYWMSSAANTVMGMWDENANLTATDVYNDPYAMQSITAAYQAMPGNEGKTPTETEVASMIGTMKPEWKVAQDTFERNIGDLTTSLREMGTDQETIDYVTDLYNITEQSGGNISVNPDGTIGIVGEDGEIMTYTDQYGREQQMTLGDKNITGLGASLESLKTSMGTEAFTDYFTAAFNNEFESEDNFVGDIKANRPEEFKQSGITEEQLRQIYKDIQSGELKQSDLISGTATGTTEATTEGYNTFLEDAAANGVNISRDQWEEAGGNTITTYSDYKRAVEKSPSLKLNTLDVDMDDLTSKTNSKVMFDAYSSNPDEFMKTDFYVDIPSESYLKEHSDYSVSGGAQKTSIDSNLRRTLDGAIGKIGEYINNETKESVIGQLISYETTPSTVKAIVKTQDGKEVSVPIVWYPRPK